MTPDDLKRAGVRVRPLAWYDAPGSLANIQCEGVATVGGNYMAYARWHGQYGKVWYLDLEGEGFVSLDEAKAAAQQHYENAILSALEPIHE